MFGAGYLRDSLDIGSGRETAGRGLCGTDQPVLGPDERMQTLAAAAALARERIGFDQALRGSGIGGLERLHRPVIIRERSAQDQMAERRPRTRVTQLRAVAHR